MNSNRIDNDIALEADSLKISRPALHAVVADRIREMIVRGDLTGGTRLNERALCESLGISRTPLREAIKVLTTEGLVEAMPNRGARVASLSEKELRDAFELLGYLESFGAELACERMTEQEMEQIRSLTTEMLACFDRNDLLGYYELNRQIHHSICRGARNDALYQAYIGLNHRLESLRFRSNLDRAKWEGALRDHVEMISAFEARDVSRISSIMRRHILAKRDAILSGAMMQITLSPR